MNDPTPASLFSVTVPLPSTPSDLPVEQLPLEVVSAARAIRNDLRHLGITLGGAYDRALVAAADGSEDPANPVMIDALEAGRQATQQGSLAPKKPRDNDAPTAVEIVTLRRFRAAGREFEPDQRYRLTALEFAEVEWRAALEPSSPLFRPATT